ncbi:MAG: HAD family hydrolase [Nocardioidaceae bacterium]
MTVTSNPLAGVRVLLCDADGTLFASEEPAFAASAGVTNDFLNSLGVAVTYSPEELRRATTGKNFRATAVDLCRVHGVTVASDSAGSGESVLTSTLLEEWVDLERRTVTKHLATALRPDAEVNARLAALASRYALAAVSSSATVRLRACLEATGMADLFPPDVVFSAEDSLEVPVSKPHPAVYLLAGQRLGCSGSTALAVEDSPTGAQSAVAAGFPTMGNLHYVPREEQQERRAALMDAGVVDVAGSWGELAGLLVRSAPKERG